MTTNSTLEAGDDAPYNYEIRLASSFEDVLEPDNSGADLGVEGLAEGLRRWACVLLQARGGAGKTYTASRVRDLLHAEDIWTVMVPAVDLIDAEDIESWSSSRWAEAGPDSNSHDGRVRRDLAAEGRPGVVVIDGLNEVDRPTGERILAAVGPITATDPQISFLITDRLTRRQGMSRHWRHATLGLVPPETVLAIAGPGASEAMRVPYYLRRHSQGQAAHDILRDSITRFVDDDDLNALAEASYEAYRDLGRRSIGENSIAAAVGVDAFERMCDARCLIGEANSNKTVESELDRGLGQFRFEHHLLHDFLAGWHLARNRSLWNDNGFDIVTLKASSFDALALALAVLDDFEHASDLVQSVYNWNYYAAAYMLEEDRLGANSAGDALAVALLAALAEKRFDGIVPTAQRVEDALRVNQTELASHLLEARDRDEVVAIVVANVPETAPEWFDQWIERFARAPGALATVEDVAAVASSQPVLGWGAANAMRRLLLTDEGTAVELRGLLAGANDTVRWRAAHAIGPHASTSNFAALLDAFDREQADSWVAYGVLRALFEQARGAERDARSSRLEAILETIGPALAQSSLLRAEAIRCLEVDPLPADWHRDAEPVLEYLWRVADERGAAELAALAARLRERKEKQEHAA